VNAATWTCDGAHAVTGSDDTQVCVHDPPAALRATASAHRGAASPPLFKFPTGHTNNIFAARVLGAGLRAGEAASLVTAAADGLVKLHTLRIGGAARPAAAHSATLASHGRRAHRVACDGAGSRFASCGEDGRVLVFDARSPRAPCAEFFVRGGGGAGAPPLRLFALDWRSVAAACASRAPQPVQLNTRQQEH
jgi:hypothetical protein